MRTFVALSALLILTASAPAQEDGRKNAVGGVVKAVDARAGTVAKVVRTAQSGSWSEAATWEGGQIPAAGVKVLVREGHAVRYDVKSDAVLRSLHIAGTLFFAHDQDTRLNVGLLQVQHGEDLDENGFEPHSAEIPNPKAQITNVPGVGVACLCCDGKPALLVGTPEQPIDARYTAVIRLHYVEGTDKESCPAIVCCGGRMDFHGAPLNRTWVKLGATARAPRAKGERNAAVPPTTELTLAEPVEGWRAGDRVIITGTGGYVKNKPQSEERTVRAVHGTRLTLDRPLEFDHAGEGEFRAEVANLSRNVIVESADPAGVRGHTMYHKKSAGSVSYAEFRHLGKAGMLGRYSLHYHLCGDTMRGSSVVGASIWDSHNRWLTIHGTDYLVVRDCVGYQSTGHGFFLEDGTEVYNVLDRNLAVQVREGKPLPQQPLPFDNNDGAGFWWANCHNTFTRNVAAECAEYGFRFEATPRAGVVVKRGATFGAPRAAFDLTRPVRQPDGTRKPVDIRTLPFVRFADNEAHHIQGYGLNLGQDAGGVGPDARTPLVVRNMKVWNATKGYNVDVPHVLIDGLHVHLAAYGVWGARYQAQDYRNVRFTAVRGHIDVASLDDYVKAGAAGEGNSRVRLPGFPAGKGDGGAQFRPAAVEVAKLDPVDDLPPITVLTHVRRQGRQLLVRGTTSDNGTVRAVWVNGREAAGAAANFGAWEAVLDGVTAGPLKLTAHAEDDQGNVEKTKHELTLVIR